MTQAKDLGMKSKMAAMRAAKAKKDTAKKAALSASTKDARLEDAIQKAAQQLDIEPEELKQELVAEAPKAVVGIPAAQKKSWQIFTMRDLSKIPDNQIPYLMHYLKIELTRAVRTGKLIDYFTWYEGQRIVCSFVDDPFGG